KKGLSAGRVQSVAARLICDREREIQAFQPQEYWTVEVELEGPVPPAFSAKLYQIDGEKASVPDQETARRITEYLRQGVFTVSRVQRKEKKRNPAPPFNTSTLQQEAARRLNFTARRTMTVAQQL